MDQPMQPSAIPHAAPGPIEAPEMAQALTPEAVASAVAILGEVAKAFAAPAAPVSAPDREPRPLEPPKPATPAAEPVPGRLEAVAAGLSPAPRQVAESRLRSSRLWTTVGGVGALVCGQFSGLPPITQVCITALAGLYLITRTMQGGR